MYAKTLILLASLLAAGCGDYDLLSPTYPPGLHEDIKGREVSPSLCTHARIRAQKNATVGNPLIHTELDPLVHNFGVLAENVGTAADWQGMYDTWRKSPAHNGNINAKMKYIGFWEAVSPATGQKCYVVIYSTRTP